MERLSHVLIPTAVSAPGYENRIISSALFSYRSVFGFQVEGWYLL